jgi:hypothetical protein
MIWVIQGMLRYAHGTLRKALSGGFGLSLGCPWGMLRVNPLVVSPAFSL